MYAFTPISKADTCLKKVPGYKQRYHVWKALQIPVVITQACNLIKTLEEEGHPIVCPSTDNNYYIKYCSYNVVFRIS